MAQTTVNQPSAAAAAALRPERPYVDWPAILAGAVVATAISILLMTFGSAIGLSLTPLMDGGGSATAVVLAVGLWVLWVAVSSFMVGGYISGRMRRPLADATSHETEIRDGIHGLVMWGVGGILGAAIAGLTLSTGASLGARTVSGAIEAAVEAAEGPDNGDLYTVDRLFRSETGGREVGEPVLAQSARILAESEQTGELLEQDSRYLAELVARNTGLEPDAAQTRVDDVWADIQAAGEAAAQAADNARRVAIMAAFIIAASLLVGGAGAWWTAGMGGRHRDEQREFLRFAGRRNPS